MYSVSELVQEARASLEAMYPLVAVEGEISNAKVYPSGHFYFSLKDSQSQIPGVFFADAFSRIPFRPENGLRVVVQGRLSIYTAQGKFQIIGLHMEPRGKGSLQLAFEQLKAKLQKEGLFDASRKKPLPPFPQWVGVITSPEGAALRDILAVLQRRFLGLRLLILPVRVQGAGAAEEIAEAIEYANRHLPGLEVLLLARGGGSLEDLWAFNEEIVARAIAASNIPILSGVGHETDFTIADFVADLRAQTPSAAAELLIQAKADILQHISHLSVRLRQSLDRQIDALSHRLESARTSRMLRHPKVWLEERTQDVDLYQERLLHAMDRRCTQWQKDLALQMQKLHLLSPMATLGRGYAIVWHLPSRNILKNARETTPGDSIEVQLRQGRLYAQIERTEV